MPGKQRGKGLKRQLKPVKEKIPESLENQPTPHPLPTVPRAEYRRRRFIFYIFLVLVTGGFIVLTLFAKQDSYFPFDLAITLVVQSITNPLFNLLMMFISYLGYLPQMVVLAAIGIGFLLFKGRRKEAVMLGVSTFGGEALAEVFKTWVHRARPSPLLVHQVGHFMRKDSFPSGHVLFYVGFFGFLLFLTFSLFPKGWGRTWLLVLFSLLILLVGPSRIYLGDHWFSDVLGAYMLGFLWLTATIYLYNRFNPEPKA